MKFTFSLGAIFVVILLVALAVSPAYGRGGQGGGNGQVISVFGEVPGRGLLVHLWVVAPPGAEKSEVARQALGRQGARPIDSQQFTTDFSWDQFSDGNAGNDFVTQNYNPKKDPTGGQGKALLQATQSTWTNVPTSGFAFVYGGETGRCPSLVLECRGPQKFDGKNDVAWLKIGGCCTLGVTWFGTSTDEADMALNLNFDWFTSGSDFDVETVFLHENGHVAGLGHSGVVGAVMEPNYGGVRRALHSDDIAGITSLYPAGTVNNPPSVSISSPADGVNFGTGDSISFAALASDNEDDDVALTASIAWTDNGTSLGTGGGPFSAVLSDGSHTITAEVTDSGGATGSDSISITVGTPPAEASTVTVTTPSGTNGYATEGGKNGDKHLLTTVTLVDNLGNPVSGAAVSIKLSRQEGGSWTGSGTTDATGEVTFSIRNAKSGTYTTDVTNVNAAGLTWVGGTPANSFTK